ncbi:MAG: hypothetical protein HY026_10060 [Deltaproteobacteria bacterium]|nr:hypothetical protein [Deltaproteobacteria bacterium]
MLIMKYLSCVFLAIALLCNLSFAEEGSITGSVEAEGWYAWWVPFTSRNEEKGILTKYKIDPAFLQGATVSMRSEGRGYYALQYLTSRLEGEINSKAIEERRDKVIFDEFVRWRGDILQSMTDERYLYTRLVYGGFTGKAEFTDTTSFVTPQKLGIDSQFVVGDMLWTKFSKDKYLVGFGLRLMNYKIPAVVYKTTGDIITDTKFSDTEFRGYALSFGVFDGSRVSKEGKSPEIPFLPVHYNIMGREGVFTIYLDDFLLYLGYAESENSVMGKGRGATVGMEGASGFKINWEFRRSSLIFNMGVRFIYNLISTSTGDKEKNDVTSEDMFIGPFLNLRWVF